jgi:hypothetical protein
VEPYDGKGSIYKLNTMIRYSIFSATFPQTGINQTLRHLILGERNHSTKRGEGP